MWATILLVDDEPAVLEGLSLSLRSEPYTVLAAASAAEALHVLDDRHVDLVVSDEHMPGMGGAELLGRIARQRPEVVRMILTGRPDLEVAVRSINEAKVAGFLRKPCAPDDLRAVLRDALRGTALTSAALRLLRLARSSGDPCDPRDPCESRESTERAPAARETAEDRRASPGHAPVAPALLLSEREHEVFVRLVDGRRPVQIARALFLSTHTVRNHLKAIFRKLDVHSQAELLEKYRPGR